MIKVQVLWPLVVLVLHICKKQTTKNKHKTKLKLENNVRHKNLAFHKNLKPP